MYQFPGRLEGPFAFDDKKWISFTLVQDTNILIHKHHPFLRTNEGCNFGHY